ncbi:spore coat protein U domain-containing protein [Persephonella sp. KM09-Lau-8]|uniref:spore coat protein U domain-containing protein n=1 Tax=Persephonella sp. KM09-Lau-8 TaxID=1158345 RepID=UPI000494DCBC|nr:spore coat protein U domain-containing protein [Persephonella sp. KM09-Lau-8]
MKRKIIASILGVGVVWSGSVAEGTATDSYTVEATVSPYCEILSLSDVSISYNPYRPSVTSEPASFSFKCVKGTNFQISATSANGGYLVKTDDPDEKIAYSLGAYVQYASSTAFSSDIFTTSLSATAETKEPPVAALRFTNIPSGQNVSVGTYTDTVTLTITY